MLKRKVVRAGWMGSVAALLLVEGALYFLGSAHGPVSETSSLTVTSHRDVESPSTEAAQQAGPTPTHVSELAPAVMLPPREPAALPASGAEREAGTPWPKATGIGLAVLGVALIYSALRLRPHEGK